MINGKTLSTSRYMVISAVFELHTRPLKTYENEFKLEAGSEPGNKEDHVSMLDEIDRATGFFGAQTPSFPRPSFKAQCMLITQEYDTRCASECEVATCDLFSRLIVVIIPCNIHSFTVQ